MQYYYETRDVILYRFLISFLCVLFMFSFMTSQRIECVTRFAVIHSAAVFRRCPANIVVKLTTFKCFWYIQILIYIYTHTHISIRCNLFHESCCCRNSDCAADQMVRQSDFTLASQRPTRCTLSSTCNEYSNYSSPAGSYCICSIWYLPC